MIDFELVELFGDKYTFKVNATPLSVNHYLGTRGKIRFVKPEGIAFKQLVSITAPTPYPVFADDVMVHLKIVRPANRGDLDNFSKLCLDSLKGIAYDDDKRIKILILDGKTVDKHNPSVTFTVIPISQIQVMGYNLDNVDK